MFALFAGCWAIAVATADGFLEDDAWTHYLYSRFAFAKPAYLLDVWGRPMCTGLYALAAPWAGMMGCRAISLLLLLACVVLTMRTAKALRIDERVSAIFLLGQPMLFLHSLSVMTELPFAVLLIAAFLCFLRGHWWAMALLVGLLPLTRPEGFGFVLLGVLVLVIYRQFLWLPLLILPITAWSWLGWWMWGASPDHAWWQWLPMHWPYSAASTYGHGWLLQFVGLMPVLIGPSVVFVILALARYAGRGLGEGSSSIFEQPFAREAESSLLPSPEVPGEGVSRLLLVVIPLLMLVAHSLLWWLGKMASYGEIRYLLIVSPFWAILAAAGWQSASIKPSPTLIAAIGLLVAVGFRVTTLRSSAEGRIAHQVTIWYETVKPEYPRVIASHPAVYVHLDRPPGEWNVDALSSPADHSVVLWDPKCGPFNADNRLVTNVAGLESIGWITLRTFDGGWVAMVRK